MSPEASVIGEILDRYPAHPSSLIMVLQDLQTALNYIPEEAVTPVAKHLSVPRSRVYAAASFYKALSLEPRGRHQIDICLGTACHVRGAGRLVDQLSEELKISPGKTTDDREFSLNAVHCVGACALGPVAIVDGVYHGEVTSKKLRKAVEKCKTGETCPVSGTAGPCPTCTAEAGVERLSSPSDLQKLRKDLEARKSAITSTLSICSGSGCRALGSENLFRAFQEGLKQAGLADRIALQKNGCHGFCERGLIVIVRPQGLFYQKVTVEEVPEIIETTLVGGGTVDRLLYTDPATSEKIALEKEIPFYRGQKRLLMERNSSIDPLSIKDYIAGGGYEAMARALFEMAPDRIIDEISRAGLRGRGGGGFHAARKWASCRKSKSDKKYILCNADEGDPGAFMDCSLLEGNPHSVIEGMVIGAFAIAGKESQAEGYVYVRHEYPMAVANLAVALDQARAAGLLGEDILGSGFSYDIRISRGGGSFVCGESTALMVSIEGRIGEPRAKYIHTSTAGLYNKPTVLNNVETWANVPLILRMGATAYAGVGTDKSKGTKIFSLVGKVNHTGLVEVPMGITLRKIIFDIGGGIRGGKRFKAVQTGGPSGGCVPESLLDLPVDFEELTRVGSMMGSGGMIVMDEDTCMVDVARYFTEFLTEESCGKCAACRLGLEQLLSILKRICAGKGRAEDIPQMEKLFAVLDEGSLCGLGKSAANPVRSTLKFFRGEYESHIFDKKCVAGVCRNLFTYAIDESCTGCTLCLKECPRQAISGEKKKQHVIDETLCDRCGLCVAVCKFDSVVVR